MEKKSQKLKQLQLMHKGIKKLKLLKKLMTEEEVKLQRNRSEEEILASILILMMTLALVGLEINPPKTKD
jgi:type IV secretory pathway component VirB8